MDGSRLQVVHIHPVYVLGKPLLKLRDHRFHPLFRFRFAVARGSHPEHDLPFFGIGGDRRVGHLLHLLAQLGFKLAFADPEEIEAVGAQDMP